MAEFVKYLENGLARKMPEDRIGAANDATPAAAAAALLVPYLRRHRSGFLFGLGLMLTAAVAGLAAPMVTRFLIDDVILGKKIGLLAGTVVLLAACVAAEKIIELLEKFFFARLEQKIALDVHSRVVSRLMLLPKAFFDGQHTGYLTSRVTEDIEGMRWLFSDAAIRVLTGVLRFGGGLGLLIYLEWRLAVVTLFVLPVLIFLLKYFSGRIYILAHRRLERRAEAEAGLQQSIAEATLIKSCASEDAARISVLSAFRRFLQASLEQVSVSSVAEALINSLPAAGRGIVLAGGAVLITKDQWTLGSLLAFQAYLGTVFGPAQYLATANLQMQKSLAALSRVSALFHILPEENHSEGIEVKRLRGEIEFRSVGFSYNGREDVLRDVCLHIKPGQRVAIVGPSGVGKTTLISLLLRFYLPSTGEIFYDGRAAGALNVRSLRRRIGYVSQQPRLLAGTIMENLCYGNPDASEEEVVRAAEASGIDGFVRTLADGYGSHIGENGVNLSEGQKQRLSLARTLIKDPDIYMLDEPTAGVDGLTETSILDSLHGVVDGKTTFIVTHSLRVVENCDCVILLNRDGRCILGTPSELSRMNPLYREMFAKTPEAEGKRHHENTKTRKYPTNSVWLSH